MSEVEKNRAAPNDVHAKKYQAMPDLQEKENLKFVIRCRIRRNPTSVYGVCDKGARMYFSGTGEPHSSVTISIKFARGSNSA